jgi:hypothetical protein
VSLFGAYNAAAARTFSSAQSAHDRLDCASAVEKFRRVQGFYGLALTTSKKRARTPELECTFILDGESHASKREHEESADDYANAIEANPASPLRAEIERREASQLLAWSKELVFEAFDQERPDKLLKGLKVHRQAHTQFPDELVRHGNAYVVATRRLVRMAERNPCEAIDYMEAIDEEFAEWRSQLGTSLYRCADERFAARQYTSAQFLYERVIREAPAHELVASARRKAIAAEVAAIRGKGTGELPAPVRSGSSGSSSVEIRVRNSSPYGLEYLISGPDARRITVPACAGCREYPRGQEPTSCPPGPVKTIRVRAGSYTEVVRSLHGNVTDWSGEQTFSAGGQYAHCFYIVTSRD